MGHGQRASEKSETAYKLEWGFNVSAHIIKRADCGGMYYLVDGDLTKSLKTKTEEYAKKLLDQYARDRLGLVEISEPNAETKAMFKRFGPPNMRTNFRRLRFPCVYAVIRQGEVIYVGSSVNGVARILHSCHKMFAEAANDDELVFWTTGTEGEARELEMAIIRAVKPRLNIRAYKGRTNAGTPNP